MRFKISLGVVALLAGLLLCWQPDRVSAGGRLPTVRYRGGEDGPVVFDHQTHASKGFRCGDCHTDFAGTGKILFTTRKQALIDFQDHATATKCFACHNGDHTAEDRKGAFRTGKGAFDECDRCHRGS
jgi:c(7)-type cytochrome triheme protein